MTLLSAFLLSFSFATSITTYELKGEVSDTISLNNKGIQTYAITRQKGLQKLIGINSFKKNINILSGATFVGTCPRALMDYSKGQLEWKDHLLLEHPMGVNNLMNDKVILKKRALFPHADRYHLYEKNFCNENGEMLYFSASGIEYLNEEGRNSQHLPFQHYSKAYTSKIAKNALFRSDYANAMSLYTPKVHWLDVDMDGDLDFILELHHKLTLYLRNKQAQFEKQKELDLRQYLHLEKYSNVELLIEKVDHKKGYDLLVTTYKGRLPQKSEIYLLSYDQHQKYWSTKKRLNVGKSFSVPIAVDNHRIILRDIETGSVALGQALMTGQTSVKIRIFNAEEMSSVNGPKLDIKIDIRAGKVVSLPQIYALDFNNDDHLDLLHFPSNKEIEIYSLKYGKSNHSLLNKYAVKEIESMKYDDKGKQVILFHGYQKQYNKSTISILKP